MGVDATGRVHAEGSRSARIIVIGEAPGDREVALGRPFVGPTGQLWQRWLEAVGLQRSDCWIDNVYPFRAPGSKIEAVDKRVVAPWAENLHARLAELDDPWVIVPMGNLALKALLNLPSITKWRGSILIYRDLRGRHIKVIPTRHPAACFRAGYLEKRCRMDWKRIAGDATFRELRLPVRDHQIRPTLGDLRDFVEEAKRAERLAIDIETPRERRVEVPLYSWACWGCGQSGETYDVASFPVAPFKGEGMKRARKTATHRRGDGTPCGPVMHAGYTQGWKARATGEVMTYGPRRVTCVGFSDRPGRSLTIPTTLSYWRDQRLLTGAWAAIKTLCESPMPKVLQNGHFDAFYLALDHRIRLANWRYDTLAMHHVVDPVEDHDLAYLTSIYTREPYYKDDIKSSLGEDDDDAEATQAWAERPVVEEEIAVSQETYWTYNGKDACVTHEISSVLEATLRGLA